MEILRAGAYYSVTQVIERLVSLFLFGFLYSFANKNEISNWLMSMTTSGILVSVTTIGISMYIVRELPSWSYSHIRRLYPRLLLMFLLLVGAICLGSYLFHDQISQGIYGNISSGSLTPLLLFFVLCECLVEINNSVMRVLKKHYFVANVNVTRSLLKLLAILISLVFHPFEIRYSLAILLGLESIVALISCLKTHNQLRTLTTQDNVVSIGIKNRFTAFKFILVFTLVNATYSINGFSDRYFIVHNLGNHALVNYSVYAILMSPVTVAYATITYIIGPEISTKKSTTNPKLGINHTYQGIKLLYIVSPYILAIIYLNSKLIFSILKIGQFQLNSGWFFLMGSSIMLFGVHMIQMSKIALLGNLVRILPLLSIAAAANVALNFCLLQKYGQVGIFFANVISNILLVISSTHLMNKLRSDHNERIWTPLRDLALRSFILALMLYYLSVFKGWEYPQSWLLTIFLSAILGLELKTWGRKFRKGAQIED